jgi:hypothetical protein
MYQVTFVDGEEFVGGEPNNSLWDNLSKKPIKSLIYWLNEDLKFSFSNFEEYNHSVERIKGVNNGLEVVSKAIIMGRVGKRVYQVIYDLKRGTVHQLVTKYGEEYSHESRYDIEGNFLGWNNGKPLSGWKYGILNADFPGPKLKKIIPEEFLQDYKSPNGLEM